VVVLINHNDVGSCWSKLFRDHY